MFMPYNDPRSLGCIACYQYKAPDEFQQAIRDEAAPDELICDACEAAFAEQREHLDSMPDEDEFGDESLIALGWDLLDGEGPKFVPNECFRQAAHARLQPDDVEGHAAIEEDFLLSLGEMDPDERAEFRAQHRTCCFTK